MSLRIFSRFLLFLFLCPLAPIRGADPSPSPSPSPATGIDEKLFRGMQWRQVGPFRGGRALAVEGIPGEPGTYYFGAVAGGVWPRTAAQTGRPFSIKKRSHPSAQSPSLHRIITSFTSEPVKLPFAATSPMG